jgi:hypothetical protein
VLSLPVLMHAAPHSEPPMPRPPAVPESFKKSRRVLTLLVTISAHSLDVLG